MAYKITGSLTDTARVIVLNESDMSIEYNTTHSGGTFETTELTEGNKIVIARSEDGEAYGFGGVTPTS